MATTQVAFRFDVELLTRIDRQAERLSQPGLPATRADAVRVLVLKGLEVMEQEKRSPPRARRGSRGL